MFVRVDGEGNVEVAISLPITVVNRAKLNFNASFDYINPLLETGKELNKRVY
ncbi:MAG: hypothetical protein QXX95_00770 [Nitrososphaerales archaeon]